MDGKSRTISYEVKDRNSGVELLRIIAMVMIVAHHYIVQNSFYTANLSFSVHKMVVIFSGSGGKLGVALFVLISGYYGCKSTFRLKHVVMLMAKTWIYSVLIMLTFLFFFPNFQRIGTGELVFSFVPTLSGTNWFVPVYLVLYIFSPYLNLVIGSISRIKHFTIILFLLCIWAIIPTISFDIILPAYSYLSSFILLYFIAAYIRLYPDQLPLKYHIIMIMVWAAIIFVSIIGMEYMGCRFNFLRGQSTLFAEFNKLPTVMLAVEVLLVFVKTKPFFNRFINVVAATTFGVYLIHENTFIKNLLWKKLFIITHYDEPFLFWIHYIAAVVVVFAACSVIDYVVWKLFMGKFVSGLCDKYFKKISVVVKSISVWLMEKVSGSGAD